VTKHRSGSEKRAYLGDVNDVKKRTQNRTLRKTIGDRDPCGSRGPMDHTKGAFTEECTHPTKKVARQAKRNF